VDNLYGPALPAGDDVVMAYRGGLAVAALALTVAGCGRVLPLGPDASPAPSQLAVPIILQLALSQPPLPSGGCQAGYVTPPAPGPDAPGASGACYRKTGTPVTFTSAAVTLYLQPAGSEPVQHPTMWGLAIRVPGAEAAALTAITTKSCDTRDALAISLSGTTWAVVMTAAPLTNGRFVFMTQSKSQALQLQRTLVPSD
jgi:hypothetical protein